MTEIQPIQAIQPTERVDMMQRVDQVRRRIAAIEKMIGISSADFQTTLEREIARQAALNPAEPTKPVAEVQPPGKTQPVNDKDIVNSAKVAEALREAEKLSPSAKDEPKSAEAPKPYLPGEEALPQGINPTQPSQAQPSQAQPSDKTQPQNTPQQTQPKIDRLEVPDGELKVPDRDDQIRSNNYLGMRDELTPTEDLIMQTAYEYGVDPKLVRAIAIAESDMNQDEISDVGAIGVMQLMPETAAGLGVDPYEKRDNIVGGTMYIRQMLDTFDGDVPLAVAAYNAGPGAVKRYGGIPPYAETQKYVGRVLDLFQ